MRIFKKIFYYFSRSLSFESPVRSGQSFSEKAAQTSLRSTKRSSRSTIGPSQSTCTTAIQRRRLASSPFATCSMSAPTQSDRCVIECWMDWAKRFRWRSSSPRTRGLTRLMGPRLKRVDRLTVTQILTFSSRLAISCSPTAPNSSISSLTMPAKC